MQEHLENLRRLALRHGADGFVDTAIPGVAITLRQHPMPPAFGLFEPRFCLVLQGAKEVTIGERRMRYDPNTYFLASLDVPASGCIIAASEEAPYIGLNMALDAQALAAVIT